MRVAGIIVLSLFLANASAGEDKRATAEALFARAKSALQFNSSPYRLRGHFRLVLDKPVEGILMKSVLAEKEVWRPAISFPGFSQTIVKNGDRRWVRRNLDFTPMRVTELTGLLAYEFKVGEKEKIESIKEEQVGSTRATCVELKEKSSYRQVCVDAASGAPLRIRSSWPGTRREIDYDDYSAIGSGQLPHKLRLSENGAAIAELWLDSFSIDPPDKSLFDPLPDAVVWPTCSDVKAPAPVSTPDPHYTEIDKRNHVEGIVGLQLVIDENGHTRNAVVTHSLSAGLDREAQAAVSKWRFRPGICGSTPIPVEMNVEVGFRLSR